VNFPIDSATDSLGGVAAGAPAAGHPLTSPHRDDWRRLDRITAIKIAAGALGFRVISAILGFFVNLAVDPPRTMTVFPEPTAFWDQFAHWDSGWYEPIARYGYSYFVDSRCNIGFFPVYPFLMRYVGRLFGTYHAAYFFGGIIVSWACFVLAMVALYFLARLDLPRRQAERAVLLTAIFPFSYFFGVVYAESTFLLFAVLAFLLFRTRRWILGGVCASVAIATRVPGFLIWPALAWIAWTYARPTWRDRGLAAIGLVLAMTGFAWYCAYIYSLSGHPFEWVATIQKWNYHPGGLPWTAPMHLLGQLFTHPYVYLKSVPSALADTLYGLTAILFVAAIPFVWRRFGVAYATFMLLTLWLPLSSGAFEGIGRYCSILFPCFLWLATIRSRGIFSAIIAVFALFYTLGYMLFLINFPLY
jgi:hypothetical protein